MQLLQMSRCPSQRTLRARQVTHVLEGFFGGLEAIMDHECECEGGHGSDHRVGVRVNFNVSLRLMGNPSWSDVSGGAGRSTEAEERFPIAMGLLDSTLTGTEPASQQRGE